MLRLVGTLFLIGATLGLARADGLRSQVPEGSIDSIEKADRALAVAQDARNQSDADFAAGQKACYHKVLVNACITAVKDARRQRVAQIDAVEIEAKRFKRTTEGSHSAADRKDKADQKAANAEQDAAQRVQNRTDYDARQVDAARKEQQRADQAGEAPGHAAAQAGRVTEAGQKQANQTASQREHALQNAKAEADQKQKEQDAQERHDRLAKKHVEKESERAEKASAQETKNATLPPAPPAQSALPVPAPDLALPR
jgi:colicin import membrane protein